MTRRSVEAVVGSLESAGAQARRMAALSLAEKLDWLEDAHALVIHMQAQRSRKGAGTDPV